ncbi:MAG: AHH domain-containing protein [Planctomycetaceae bacterium]|nr:AHH domain-containing protein [Planctomycetaceae bacterium]
MHESNKRTGDVFGGTIVDHIIINRRADKLGYAQGDRISMTGVEVGRFIQRIFDPGGEILGRSISDVNRRGSITVPVKPKRLEKKTVTSVAEEKPLPMDDVFADASFLDDDERVEGKLMSKPTTTNSSMGWQPTAEPVTRKSFSLTGLLKTVVPVVLLIGGIAGAFCCWPGSDKGTTELQASVAPTETKYTTGHKRIADITPGFKVWANNPTDEQDYEFGADVDPETWKLLTLRASHPNGSQTDIRLLRPDEWLATYEAETGKQIYLYLQEMGIESDFDVLKIEPCPEILDGPGRIVTATFKHSGKRLIDLKIASEETSIGTTPNHPFWSEDRHEFVRADELRKGEKVRTLEGVSYVESVTSRAGLHTVYNLEVQVDHVYHVGSGGVLVHNACSSRRLGRNLKKAGYTREKNYAAHHITAHGDERAAKSRAILKKFNIDLDSAENGVFLPGNKTVAAGTGLPAHSTIHTRDYYRAVEEKLLKATSREEAVDYLEEIRNQLLNNTFTY